MCWSTFAEARQVNRAAERTAEDVLHELRPLRAIDDVVVFVRVKPRRLVELEERSVEIVRAGLGYERNLRAAAAPEVGGEVACHHLKLLKRIRIRADRREV